MSFSNATKPQESLLKWMVSEEAYHHKIKELCSRSIYNGLIVKKDEGLVQVNLSCLFLEKIKGRLGLSPDWSNETLIGYHIIQLIDFGSKKQWITEDEKSSLLTLSGRVNGIQQLNPAMYAAEFLKNNQNELQPFGGHINQFSSNAEGEKKGIFRIPEKKDFNFNTDSWCSLHHASADNSQQDVKTIIQNHPEMIAQKDKDSCTPLHIAACFGNLEIVKLLIRAGADVHTKCIRGANPLFYAVYGANCDLIKYLLSLGIDVNATAKDDFSVLHVAMYRGYLKTIEFLINNGAKINAKNKYGKTPLEYAVKFNQLDNCRFLLARGADVNNVNNKGYSLLHYAASKGSLEICKLLLANGAHIENANKHGHTALDRAASKGYLEICKLLLAHGAKIENANKNGSNPLHFANYNSTPLHFAAYNGHLDICKLFLAHGGKVEDRDKNGCTALHLASEGGHLEVCKFLAANGAKIDSANKNGYTPLHLASGKGHLEICKFLAANGAKIDCANKRGSTALQVASVNGHLEICKFLVENGAKIDFANQEGLTAIVRALRKKHFAVVDFLIEKGANIYVSSKEKKHLEFLATFLIGKDEELNKYFKLLGKRDSVVYDCTKEYRQRKLLAHLSEIEGTIDLSFKKNIKKIKKIDLMGWLKSPFYLWKKIAKSLSNFMKEFPDLIDAESVHSLIKMFQAGMQAEADENTTAQYLQWQSGLPLIVNYGYNAHYASLLFWEDQYILCDRAAGNRPTPLEAFTFDEKNLNENLLKKIKETKKKGVDEFIIDSYHFERELETLKSSLHEKIDKLPLSWQKTANCAWANSEGIVLAFLLLAALKKNENSDAEKILEFQQKQVKAYEHWKSYLMIETLNRYLDKAPKRALNVSPDYKLAAQVFAKDFPKPTMDPRLIEKWKKGKEKFLKTVPLLDKIRYLIQVFRPGGKIVKQEK